MANDKRGQVGIQLLDPKSKTTRSYTVRYDMNTLCEIEQSLGEPVSKLITESRFGIHALRECLYHGIKKQNRRLRISEVGGMINGDNFEELSEAVATAFSLAMGIDLDEEAEEVEASDPTETEEEEEKEEDTDSTGTD